MRTKRHEKLKQGYCTVRFFNILISTRNYIKILLTVNAFIIHSLTSLQHMIANKIACQKNL
jgi:hypothetical protein